MPPSPLPARLHWPDLAKGLCILLVVLHHVTRYVVTQMPDELGGVAVGWMALTTALKPVRMPLFFLVSGLFASRAITRPWGANRTRLVGGAYLYVVWLLVFWGVYSLEDTLHVNRTQDLADLAGELVWAATSMWFLYAMVVYFVVAKLLRRLPPLVVIAGAAALSLSTSALPIEETNRVAVLFHFVFFLVGAYLPDVVHAVADADWSLPGLLAAYVGGSVLMAWPGVPRSVELVLLSLVGVPLGIAVAVRLARWPVLSGPLRWLGRRTLRVYVLHMAVLSALVNLPRPSLEGPSALLLGLVAALPLVAAAVVVALSLGGHALLVRTGGGFLFAAPAALTPANVPATEPAPAGAEPTSWGAQRRVA